MTRMLVMEVGYRHVKVRFSSKMNEYDILILAAHADSMYEDVKLYYEPEDIAMSLPQVSGDRSLAEEIIKNS